MRLTCVAVAALRDATKPLTQTQFGAARGTIRVLDGVCKQRGATPHVEYLCSAQPPEVELDGAANYSGSDPAVAPVFCSQSLEVLIGGIAVARAKARGVSRMAVLTLSSSELDGRPPNVLSADR